MQGGHFGFTVLATLFGNRVSLDNTKLLTLDPLERDTQRQGLVVDPLLEVATVDVLAGDALRVTPKPAHLLGRHAGPNRVRAGGRLLRHPALLGPAIAKLVVE